MSGIQADPTEAAPRVLCSPKLFKFPINPEAECEKVNEYPQKNHYKLTKNKPTFEGTK